MPHQSSIQTRVLGGLPVEVTYWTYPPEPDVGVLSPQVVIGTLRWPTGHKWSLRMHHRLSEADWSDLEEQCYQAEFG